MVIYKSNRLQTNSARQLYTPIVWNQIVRWSSRPYIYKYTGNISTRLVYTVVYTVNPSVIMIIDFGSTWVQLILFRTRTKRNFSHNPRAIKKKKKTKHRVAWKKLYIVFAKNKFSNRNNNYCFIDKFWSKKMMIVRRSGDEIMGEVTLVVRF